VPTDRQPRAKRDLRKKLGHEARLLPGLEAAARELAREVARVTASSGKTLRADQVEAMAYDLVAPLLGPHHERVMQDFGSEIREGLSADAGPSRAEDLILTALLLAVAADRSEAQSRRVARTASKDAVAAVQVAEAERERVRAEGGSMTAFEVGSIAGQVLGAHLLGRAPTIAAYETEVPAESARLMELEVMTGRTPSAVGGAGPPREVQKEWVTQGDSRVRPAHLAADSVTVSASEPFSVGGELLMHPGDSSLGASLSNLINCRCSTFYDVDELERQREEALRFRCREGKGLAWAVVGMIERKALGDCPLTPTEATLQQERLQDAIKKSEESLASTEVRLKAAEASPIPGTAKLKNSRSNRIASLRNSAKKQQSALEAMRAEAGVPDVAPEHGKILIEGGKPRTIVDLEEVLDAQGQAGPLPLGAGGRGAGVRPAGAPAAPAPAPAQVALPELNPGSAGSRPPSRARRPRPARPRYDPPPWSKRSRPSP